MRNKDGLKTRLLHCYLTVINQLIKYDNKAN